MWQNGNSCIIIRLYICVCGAKLTKTQNVNFNIKKNIRKLSIRGRSKSGFRYDKQPNQLDLKLKISLIQSISTLHNSIMVK